MKKIREKRAAEALAAATASPPLAAGQEVPQPPAPGPTPAGAGGAAAAGPTETGAAPTEAPDKAAVKPAGDEGTPVQAEKPAKPEKQDVGKPAEKATTAEKKTAEEGVSPKPRKKEKTAAVTPQTGASTDKKPGEESKPGGETAKADTSKPGEAAKPAEGDKGEKTEKPAEAAKPEKAAEAPPAPAAPPVLKITSSPSGADVTIDGVPVGVTPFASKEVDPGGTHTIALKKDGFEPQERMISGSDWSRGKGGAQTLKFNIKLKRTGGEAPKPAEPAEKKPEVEILTPSEP
jgi:hypothetical protein